MTAIKKLDYKKIDLQKISDRINFELEHRGLNQSKLAKLTKISRETIRRLCNGQMPNPTINTLEAIADTLNIDIFELLGSYEAMSVIEEKTIPLYYLHTLNLLNESAEPERITCLVKGSENCLAIKVDHALETILVNANSMMIDDGDILVFDKQFDSKKIKNRTIVIYNAADGLPTLGEIIGTDGKETAYISQRKSSTKNSMIDPTHFQDIIAILNSIQFS